MSVITKTLSRLGLIGDASDRAVSEEASEGTGAVAKGPIVSFSDLPIEKTLELAIAKAKFVTPTPIQARAIPLALQGRDMIACAKTGTGKTAAFAIPTLNKLILELGNADKKTRQPKVLVLVPTRELAVQVHECFTQLGMSSKINSLAIYGGVSIGLQLSSLRNASPQVLVATPGRLLDIIRQRAVNLSSISTLILDEADRMLDMGFVNDTKHIVSLLPRERQTLMFSATITDDVHELSRQIMNKPLFVSVDSGEKGVVSSQIEQIAYPVAQENKRALLSHLLIQDSAMSRVIVFTRTKFAANKLAEFLNKDGIRSHVIHSGKSQSARQIVWQGFKSGKLRVLVATDLASRGMDVDGISHVVNYDLSESAETHVHRIGRTGRASKSGIAISFCSPDQNSLLVGIQRHMGKTIPSCIEHPFYDPSLEIRRNDSSRSGGQRQRNGSYRRSPSQGGRSSGGSSDRGPRSSQYSDRGPRTSQYSDRAPRAAQYSERAPRTSDRSASAPEPYSERSGRAPQYPERSRAPQYSSEPTERPSRYSGQTDSFRSGPRSNFRAKRLSLPSN